MTVSEMFFYIVFCEIIFMIVIFVIQPCENLSFASPSDTTCKQRSIFKRKTNIMNSIFFSFVWLL